MVASVWDADVQEALALGFVALSVAVAVAPALWRTWWPARSARACGSRGGTSATAATDGVPGTAHRAAACGGCGTCPAARMAERLETARKP